MSEATAPLPQLELIRGRIAELKTQLEANVPDYANQLKIIHTILAEDEALSHLLDEEEIGVICQGLSKRKGLVIALTEVKKGRSGAATKAKISQMSVGDLE